MPAGAAAAAAGAMLRIDGFDASRVLELRLLRRVARPGSPRSRRPRSAKRGRAKTGAGATTAKSGATRISPVACAPRWTGRSRPSTRPRSESGTSSCAAEVSSTIAELCASAAANAPAIAIPSEPADGDQPVAGQVERPRDEARRAPSGARASARGSTPLDDRAGRVADHHDREAAGAAVEVVAHERRHPADPGPAGDRDGDAERDDADAASVGAALERRGSLADVRRLGVGWRRRAPDAGEKERGDRRTTRRSRRRRR